ncbi:MAG: translocation/assembly module TamB [Bacteroidota bacterium]|nr:translocation/assembly module TamB [Bacteroidota bacterium]
MSAASKVGIKVLKIAAWVLGIILTIFIVLFLSIRIPAVQNYIVKQVTAFVAGKTNTTVTIGSIYIGFPSTVIVNEIFLDDLNNDTLLYAREVRAGLGIYGLIKGDISLGDVSLEKVVANISRNDRDSTFNFNFLIEALAGNKTATPVEDTASKPVNLSVDDITLREITFRFRDDVTGIELKTYLGDVTIPMHELDLDSLIFEAGDIEIHNSTIDLVMFKTTPDDTTTSTGALPRFSADGLNVTGLAFHMSNAVDSMDMYVKSGDFNVSKAEFNLKSNAIVASTVSLDRASCMIFNRKLINTETASEPESPGDALFELPFSIDVNKMDVTESVFALKDVTAKKSKEFDPMNMVLAIHRFNVKDVYHDNGTARINLLHASVTDRSGLAVKSLKGEFKTDPESVSVTNLSLVTGNSEINGDLYADFDDLQRLASHPAEARLRVNLKNTVVSVKDLLLFNEALAQQEIISKNRERKFLISMAASGTLGNIRIKQLALRTANATAIQINGTVTGLPDADKMHLNLTANRITTTSDDIAAFVTIPETVNLPEHLLIKGKFKGTLSTFNYNVAAATNRGNIIASGMFNNLQGTRPGYEVKAQLKEMDVAYLLKNDMFGPSNIKATVNGKGFQPETMDTEFDLESEKITVQGYEYNNIAFKGTIKNGELATTGAVADENLDVTLKASLGLLKEKEFYKAEINLKGIDLEALHFSDHELRANGTGIINVKGNSINNLSGNVSIKDVLIVKKGKNYPIENLAVININENKKKNVAIESSLLTARFDGSISVDETARQLGVFFKRYFTTDTVPLMPDLKEQFFSFNVVIKNAPVISEVFVPGLESFIPGPISGKFVGAESKLMVNVQLPQVIYNGIRIDSLNVRVDSDVDKLVFLASLNRLSMGDIELARTDIIATAADNKIHTGIIIAKEDNVKLRMKALISLGSKTEYYKISILEKGIILDDEQWVVPEDNYIEVGGPIPKFHNFSLTNNKQSVYIDKPASSDAEGIGFNFNDFKIGIISSIIERDSAFIGGILNGQLDLIREKEGSGLVADIKLDKFTFRGTTVGDLVLNATSEGRSKYNVNLKMTGNGNNLVAKGSYEADTIGGRINADVDINKLLLKSVEPFTDGQITRSKGFMEGSFTVTGPVSLPTIDGMLSFEDAGVNVTYLNNYLNLKNEEIRFDEEGIYLDAFTITDSLNHTAVLDGKITIEELTNPKFFIDLKTDRFLAMNTVSENNDLFFGTLIISSNIKIRGDMNLPVITSNVKLLEGSSFTFVVPENTVLTERGEEDVAFTDPYNRVNPIMKRESEQDTFKAEIKGFDITSNVEITKETTLRILVDQESGDSLVIKGDATMSFSIDPSGKTSLTGGFEINEGSYRVSLQNLVKRSFEITKGSSINWRGDIMDAEINIDAVNIVNAVPLELVADQVAGLTEQEINAYRQRLPFQVILHMTGELLRPEISFEISLRPEDQGVLNGTVYAKLTLLNQDPSELNKQVFALLVLNRFIQENPFNNESGGGLAYVARNSVSKFLSQQLNIFAEQFIKGVELNFDVQSYEEYTTGSVEGRTEVNIGASKKFFDNRLIVQVSGNVDVEGERTKQNDVSNLAGDIVLEYLLTEDGRYRLRVFRKDQYAGVLDGEVKEAGVGVLYTRDFDKWENLFSKPEEQKPINP